MGVIEEVEARIAEFVALTKAGDLAKACEMYSENATLGFGGADLIVGRASELTLIIRFNAPEITEFFVSAGFDTKGEMKDQGTVTDLGNGYAHRVGRCSVVEKGKEVKYWWVVGLL